MLCRLVSYLCIYKVCMSPALNGSSVIRRFEHSNATEIRDGKTFDFYTRLPQLLQLTCVQLLQYLQTKRFLYKLEPIRE